MWDHPGGAATRPTKNAETEPMIDRCDSQVFGTGRMNVRRGFSRIGERRAWTLRIALALAVLCGALSQIVTPDGRGVAAAPSPSAVTAAAQAPPATTPGAPVPRYVRRLGDAATAPPRAGQPARLKIAAINVDAAVEQVGKTPDGAMDVPRNFDETAWYQFGPRPGEQGNAVIDGHVDSTTGKAVFWDLRKLVRGDQIVVVGDDGVERRFIVVDMGAYATADVPLARVFGPATGVHLNLITCDSNTTFNYTTHSYDGNFIVYADAAP